MTTSNEKRLELGYLVLLTVATFGAYLIYWFYRTWRQLEETNEGKLRPALRAIGTVVPLLNIYMVTNQWKRISELDDGENKTFFSVAWSVFGYLLVTYLYAAYFVLISVAVVNGLQPTGAELISLTFLDLIALSLIGLMVAVPQRALNAYYSRADHATPPTRAQLTPGQIAWLSIGGLAWIISLLQPFFAQVT